MENELDNKIEPTIKNGKLNTFGLNISIADIVGGKIVDKWFNQLTEEDLNLIFKAVEEELFDHDYKDTKFFKKQNKVNSSWSSYNNYEDTPTWKITKQRFAEKYNDVVLAKVDEILASEEYQKRATEIANDIVNYATESYKQDMMNRVRERLVDNVIGSEPVYNNINLRDIIQQEIHNMFPNNRY